MSKRLECPICSLATTNGGSFPKQNWGLFFKDSDIQKYEADTSLEEIPNGDKREVYICPCGRATWIQDKGWTISFDFISRLYETIWSANSAICIQLKAILATVMPTEIAQVEKALDRSTVKLYCPNDNCKEEGFLTRTKAQAEKHTLFCDTCGTALQW